MKFVKLSQTSSVPASKIVTEIRMHVEPPKEQLQEEFRHAERFGEGRLGEIHFFYRYFLRIRYIPYHEIAHAYLREESGESGEFLLKEFYLMLVLMDGQTNKLRFEREANARAVLDYLGKHYPSIRIGLYKNRQDT